MVLRGKETTFQPETSIPMANIKVEWDFNLFLFYFKFFKHSITKPYVNRNVWDAKSRPNVFYKYGQSHRCFQKILTMFTYTQQKHISEMNLHSYQLGPTLIFFRTQKVPFRSGNGRYKNNYKVTLTQGTPFCNAR